MEEWRNYITGDDTPLATYLANSLDTPAVFSGGSYVAASPIAHFNSAVPVNSLPALFSPDPTAKVPVFDPLVGLNYSATSAGHAAPPGGVSRARPVQASLPSTDPENLTVQVEPPTAFASASASASASAAAATLARAPSTSPSPFPLKLGAANPAHVSIHQQQQQQIYAAPVVPTAAAVPKAKPKAKPKPGQKRKRGGVGAGAGTAGAGAGAGVGGGTDASGEPLPKKKARAARNRVASQNYRKRRKEYVTRLEKELAELKEKNEALMAQLESGGSGGSSSAGVGEDAAFLAEENKALKLQLEKLQAYSSELEAAGSRGGSPKGDDSTRSGSTRSGTDARVTRMSLDANSGELTNEEKQILLVEELHRNIVDEVDDGTIARNLASLKALRKPKTVTQEDVIKQIESDTLAPNMNSPLPVAGGSDARSEIAAVTYAVEIAEAAGSEKGLQAMATDEPAPTPLAQARRFSSANYLALSPEQQVAVSSLRATHESNMHKVMNERNDINARLKALLADNFSVYASLKAQRVNFNDVANDLPEIKVIAATLRELKANIQREAQITESLVSQFRDVLTPRQEAVWELRVCQFSHCRSRIVQAFWTVADSASLDIETVKCE